MLTSSDIRDLLGKNPGFFSVVFTKKDGTERHMNAMMGVKKHLAGGPPAYDPAKYNLLWVWDPVAAKKKPHGPKDRGYRSINVDTIRQIKARGRIWNIKNGEIIEA